MKIEPSTIYRDITVSPEEIRFTASQRGFEEGEITYTFAQEHYFDLHHDHPEVVLKIMKEGRLREKLIPEARMSFETLDLPGLDSLHKPTVQDAGHCD